jgi:hypothetical protein
MLKVAKDMVAKDMAAKDMAGTSVWLNHDERRRAKGQLIGRIRGRGEAGARPNASPTQKRRHNFVQMQVFPCLGFGRWDMRHISVWVVEFIKLLGGRRLHPIATQCPICQQMVRLHVDKAGRRHVFAHARGLYEGSRFRVHYAAKMRCVGSGAQTMFDPRPDEHQSFKLPRSLVDES